MYKKDIISLVLGIIYFAVGSIFLFQYNWKVFMYIMLIISANNIFNNLKDKATQSKTLDIMDKIVTSIENSNTKK